MKLEELKAIVDDLVNRGYGEVYVVYRDENTDPDVDVGGAYMDEDADRVVICGSW